MLGGIFQFYSNLIGYSVSKQRGPWPDAAFSEKSKRIIFFHTGCDVVLAFRGKGKLKAPGQTWIVFSEISEYDQKMSQPQTADQHTAP